MHGQEKRKPVKEMACGDGSGNIELEGGVI
jgi:hypothetical protein